MSRFNLLDEPWISVTTCDDGEQVDISMLELFSNTQKYRSLAGDMKTQDFAVLRLLLAVMQTVFSRFDSDGKPYEWLTLDERMCQTEPVDEDDLDDYNEAKEESWNKIFTSGRIPHIVCEYLLKWHDRFYLFDDKYPFCQVTKKELAKRLPEGKNGSSFAGRNMNRLISESNNKQALFSPVTGSDKGKWKDIMSEAELVKWLLMLQGYVGLSDKTTFASKDQQNSKGWLFDIGGIYLEGSNLFETILFNYMPVYREEYQLTIESPCWEFDNYKFMERIISGMPINNLSEIYTYWSRAIYMNPDTDSSVNPVSIEIVKLPAIERTNQFIEPMTMWLKNKNGDNKGKFTPQKHKAEQAMWRSFGLITMEDSDDSDKEKNRPEIIGQCTRIRKMSGIRNVAINAVSMKDDNNATSWVPTDEITDGLFVNDVIITDNSDEGWLVRINAIIDTTKDIVEKQYWGFLTDICEIRDEDSDYISSAKEELYQCINIPFTNWLETIKPDDSKEAKISEWKAELKALVKRQADSIMEGAGIRDFKGKKDNPSDNIVTAYIKLMSRLNKLL